MIIILAHNLYCFEMTTIREILAIENPPLIHRWQGSSYDNIKSKKGKYNAVPFNDVQNATIQDCMSVDSLWSIHTAFREGWQ